MHSKVIGSIGSIQRYVFYGITVLIFHTTNSVLQEAVFHLPNFNHTILLTFLQIFWTCWSFII